MNNTDFTQYDIKPEYMVNYLRYNGPHFNKKLFEFAISNMTVRSGSAQVKLSPFSKELIDNILRVNGIKLENNLLYDYLYVANMCKADFWGSSITSEAQLSKFIRDVIDDVDGYDGLVFNRWYADMCRKGIAINWEEMI